MVAQERRRHRRPAALHFVAEVFGGSRSQAAAEPSVGSPARPGAGCAAGGALAPDERRVCVAAWPASRVVVGAEVGFQDDVAAVPLARAGADGRLGAGLVDGLRWRRGARRRDADAGTAGLSPRHHPARLVHQPADPGAARRQCRAPDRAAGAARGDGCGAGSDRHPDAHRQGRAVEPRRRTHLRLAARRGGRQRSALSGAAERGAGRVPAPAGDGRQRDPEPVGGAAQPHRRAARARHQRRAAARRRRHHHRHHRGDGRRHGSPPARSQPRGTSRAPGRDHRRGRRSHHHHRRSRHHHHLQPIGRGGVRLCRLGGAGAEPEAADARAGARPARRLSAPLPRDRRQTLDRHQQARHRPAQGRQHLCGAARCQRSLARRAADLRRHRAGPEREAGGGASERGRRRRTRRRRPMRPTPGSCPRSPTTCASRCMR